MANNSGAPPLLSPAWIKALRFAQPRDRRGKPMTQDAFVEKVKITNKGMLSKWERGTDEPSLPNALLLLRFAGLLRETPDKRSVDDLAFRMTATERAFLTHFRRLPEMRQLQLLADIAVEAHQLSQQPAAREPKA